jgi:hypothetical protein
MPRRKARVEDASWSSGQETIRSADGLGRLIGVATQNFEKSLVVISLVAAIDRNIVITL